MYHEMPEVKHSLVEVVKKDLFDLLQPYIDGKRKQFDRKDKDDLLTAFWGFIALLEEERLSYDIPPKIIQRSANTLAFWEMGEKKIGMSLYNLFKSRYDAKRSRLFKDVGYHKNKGSVRFSPFQVELSEKQVKQLFVRFLESTLAKHPERDLVYRTPSDLEEYPDFGKKLYRIVTNRFGQNRTTFFEAVGYQPNE